MQFDYEKFYKENPANIHDDPTRFGFISELCKGNVVDVGCGTGTLSDYFDGEYTGFDFSSEAIKTAKDIRRTGANFEVQNALHINSFNYQNADTIVIAEFFEHVKDDRNLIKTITDTAKKGTRLIISVPNGNAIPDPSHVRTFTIPELRKKFAPLGCVKFYNWAGIDGRIILTCDLGSKQKNDLTLVMIAKNEEKGLKTSILSAIEYVDSVVVAVDNASNDKTREVAEKYADVVKDLTWKNDFSFARNFAQDGVKTKWILTLDGHEFIKECSNLDQFLSLDVDALLCGIEMENGMMFHFPKIYLNGLKFKDEVHNKMPCKNARFFPHMTIKHDRLNLQSKEAIKERNKQRDNMIPQIMGEMYKKDKTNSRACLHLGIHAQSKHKYKEAIKWFKRYLKNSTNIGERWFVYFQITICYFVMKKIFLAFWYLMSADKESPDRWEVKKLRSLLYFERGNYFKAAEEAIMSFDINRGDVSYKPWKRNDAGTWNFVGECFFRLNNFEKASLAFLNASNKETDEKMKSFFKSRSELMVKMASS